MTSDPDLQIELHLGEDGYAVTYSTPTGMHRREQALTRPKMIEAHVAVLRELQPKTVVVVSEVGAPPCTPARSRQS